MWVLHALARAVAKVVLPTVCWITFVCTSTPLPIDHSLQMKLLFTAHSTADRPLPPDEITFHSPLQRATHLRSYTTLSFTAYLLGYMCDSTAARILSSLSPTPPQSRSSTVRAPQPTHMLHIHPPIGLLRSSLRARDRITTRAARLP
jgi:hypothetical protein